jgi:hypothetical protein
MADQAWTPPASDEVWTPPDSDAVSAAPPETVGRVAGLGASALGSGAVGTLGTVISATAPRPIMAAEQWAADKLTGTKPAPTDAPYEPQLSDFVHPEKWQEAAEYFAHKGGLPEPATPTERVGYKAAQALPSAVLAPEAPVLGAVSAAAGGAASQATAEAGGSPLQQTLAGLAVGSVPALASAGAQGARALIRDPAAMAGRIADAAESGTPLTAGQATGSRTLQYLEGASSKLWGGGPIKATAEQQTQHLGNTVDNIVDNLAPNGADVSPTGAGAAINAGAATTKANMRAAEKGAYNAVDQHVPADHPVDMSGTLSKLDELATPNPDAANTTGALLSPKVAAIRDNLKADIAANGGSPVLPYKATTDLRTALGNSIDWGFAPSDPVTNGALKQIHGALKGDIDIAASSISPEASQAVSDARTLYAHNQARRDFLNSVVDRAGGPEAVYQAATNGTKQGATKIGGVMSALDPGQQNLVRATVLDRLGKANPGQQNAAGDAFNPSTYLTNWAKLDPAAKDALFGASGKPKSLRSSLDALANTMSNIRSGTKLQNFSGTGEAAGHMGGMIAAYEGIKHMLTSAHPVLTGASVAGGLTSNMILSRALVNPRTVTWLSHTFKLPTSGIPNAVNQLEKAGQSANDPDMQDLAAHLRSQQ